MGREVQRLRPAMAAAREERCVRRVNAISSVSLSFCEASQSHPLDTGVSARYIDPKSSDCLFNPVLTGQETICQEMTL
ncbi:MAG: hypothetical protein WC536_00135 [Patescibacteria group bacterium]